MRRMHALHICLILLLAGLFALSGCAKKTVPVPGQHQPAPTASTPSEPEEGVLPATPEKKPKKYTINGETYQTLLQAKGFTERGLASWYGKDFHGRKTANGEVYDMYGTTAAHKLLPFNTMVKVTNLDNGKSTVVRINDRGPFIKDRIIDLTYTTAQEIGMIGPGTANVFIEAVGPDLPENMQPAEPQRLVVQPKPLEEFAQPKAITKPIPQSKPVPFANKPVQVVTPEPTTTPEKYLPSGTFFVQIGAFGKRANAKGLKATMVKKGYPCRIKQQPVRNLWQVQVGPFPTYTKAEEIRKALLSVNDRSFVFSDQ